MVQHLPDPTARVSHLVGLGWDPRISISNQLPGDACGDAAGPGITTTDSHHLKVTCCIFRGFCFNCTPRRRGNIKIAERKEQRSGSKTFHLCYRKIAVRRSFVHSGVKIVEEITIATAVLSSRFFSTDNSEKEAWLPILQKLFQHWVLSKTKATGNRSHSLRTMR